MKFSRVGPEVQETQETATIRALARDDLLVGGVPTWEDLRELVESSQCTHLRPALALRYALDQQIRVNEALRDRLDDIVKEYVND